MAQLEKASLRQELDALKGRFGQLCTDGKLGPEGRALFEALLMLFELLMALFMEKRTAKTSRNSSLPPSQTDKDADSAPHAGTNAKGREGHHTLSGNTRTLEMAEILPVAACGRCGADLSHLPSEGYERRTRIDILFEKVITHLDAEIKPCPHCGAQTKGSFPREMAGPLQYGPGIKAYVLNLLLAQMVSLHRVQQMLRTLIDVVLSEATILKYVMQLHQALAAWEQTAIEKLLSQPTLHVDETSLRVDRERYWIHVYSAGDLTLKRLHPKRGREAIEAINIIPRYGGTIVHDCWASYLAYDHCGHGLCGSHLLRELTFVVDSNGYRWAANMKRLLQETCALVAERPTHCLTDIEYRNLRKRYRNLLTRGAKELPPIPARQNGKRGRLAKSDAHNLWERLKRYEDAVLLFAKLPQVPFTNNRAERDLRMSKVKQKVSGCFRTRQFAEAYCRISSFLQSMAYQGYNPLLAVQMALSGQIYAEG
jgi:transposase